MLRKMLKLSDEPENFNLNSVLKRNNKPMKNLENKNIKRRKNQGIVQLAKSLQALIKKAVIIYERELDEIVSSGCRDKRRIENTLDLMLGFCYHQDMLALYRKLCRYYYGIDQNATAEYVREYRDMWDSDAKAGN